MQRKINNDISLGKTVSLFDNIGASSAIDKTASIFLNATEKVQKQVKKRYKETGEYDADIAKYILGTLELVFHGMLKGIDTKEQLAHISHKNMENLEL